MLRLKRKGIEGLDLYLTNVASGGNKDLGDLAACSAPLHFKRSDVLENKVFNAVAEGPQSKVNYYGCFCTPTSLLLMLVNLVATLGILKAVPALS